MLKAVTVIKANNKWDHLIDYLETNTELLSVFMRHFVRNMNLTDEDIVNVILEGYELDIEATFKLIERTGFINNVSIDLANTIRDALNTCNEEVLSFIKNTVLAKALINKFYDVKNELFTTSINYMLVRSTADIKEDADIIAYIDNLYIKTIIGTLKYLSNMSIDSDEIILDEVREVEEPEAEPSENKGAKLDASEIITSILKELSDEEMGRVGMYIMDLQDIDKKLDDEEKK